MERILALAVWAVLFSGRLGAQDFIAGADCSHLAFFESRGILYREGGTARDALEILKSRGLNCVRLRLFTSDASQAEANPYDSINNLDYTLPLALRVKKAGLSLLLDFHYSDTWADPSHQAKPSAWTNLNFAELEAQMYRYNSNTIAAFRMAEVMPEYVQVGNEIIGGLLWPDGRVGGSYENATQWAKFGRLLKAAIRGIKDASGPVPPKIIIHIDRGGDWSATQWFFDSLQKQQVDYDILGESYYPFWHGSLHALSNCLTAAAERYAKPVAVVETAFPWTNSTPIYGIPATTEGQVQFVAELARVVKAIPRNRGIGIVWWGTEYQRLPGIGLAGFDTRSFFDREGNTLPVATALGKLAAPVRLSALSHKDGVRLTWPLSGAGMSLFATANLRPPLVWMPVTNAIDTSGPDFSITLPLNSGPLYFRLWAN